MPFELVAETSPLVSSPGSRRHLSAHLVLLPLTVRDRREIVRVESGIIVQVTEGSLGGGAATIDIATAIFNLESIDAQRCRAHSVFLVSIISVLDQMTVIIFYPRQVLP